MPKHSLHTFYNSREKKIIEILIWTRYYCSECLAKEEHRSIHNKASKAIHTATMPQQKQLFVKICLHSSASESTNENYRF